MADMNGLFGRHRRYCARTMDRPARDNRLARTTPWTTRRPISLRRAPSAPSSNASAPIRCSPRPSGSSGFSVSRSTRRWPVAANSLKEHTLGVNVFDRGLSYDPATDPTARVYMARLRSKLIEYYATAGKDDEVVIEIPKGGYTPVFRPGARVGATPVDPPRAIPAVTRRRVAWS